MEGKPMSADAQPRPDPRAWILARRKARRLAMLLVFAQLHSGYGPLETEQLLATMARSWRDLPDFCRELVRAVDEHRADLEADLQCALENWRLDRIGTVEHALLLLGAAEISCFPDIPPRVTLNEYIELAKRYCDAQAPAFINGVLDRIAKLKNKPDIQPPQHP
jgi:N utilization substance protein B